MPEPPDESPSQRPDVPSEFSMPREVSPGRRTPRRSRARPEAGGTPPPSPEGTPARSDPIAVPTSPDLVADSMISRPLTELMARTTARQRIGVVIELSAYHPEGVEGAGRDVETLLRRVAPRASVRRSRSYVFTALLVSQIRKVVQEEQNRGDQPSDNAGAVRAPRWAIHRIWPNFEVNALIHRTVVTTKCDAAQRSFDATGTEIVWA